MCTPKEFIAAAHAADMDVELVRPMVIPHPDEPDAVNVWPTHITRYPYATLVWPRPSGASGETISWGDNFEFEVPLDIDAKALVAEVQRTVDLGEPDE